jgi:hypothetical protein
MKLSPEVLIYVQSVKEYFKKNKEASDYFLNDSDDELFFEHLSQISQKNFEKTGEVMLNQEQFELLKKTIKAITISKKPDSEFIRPDEIKTHELFINESVFIEFPNFGKICLN